MNRKPSSTGASASKNASAAKTSSNYSETDNFGKSSPGFFAAARTGQNQNQIIPPGVATGGAYQARSGYAATATNFPLGGQPANSSTNNLHNK